MNEITAEGWTCKYCGKKITSCMGTGDGVACSLCYYENVPVPVYTDVIHMLRGSHDPHIAATMVVDLLTDAQLEEVLVKFNKYLADGHAHRLKVLRGES